MSVQGIATDESKIEAIKKWPTSTNVTEIQSVLGFTGYYMQFIPKFILVAQSLHKLTSGKNTGRKKAAVMWDDMCQLSFDDLKCLCTMVPMQISPGHINSIPMLVGLVWELCSTRLVTMEQMLLLPM